MNIGEFEDLLDRLGEDISTWPMDKQRPAARLLAESSEARDLVRDAVALRGLMARPPISAPPDLSERIFERAAAMQEPQEGAAIVPAHGLTSFLRQHWATVFAVCFVAGILTGIFQSHFRKGSTAIDIHDYVAYVLNFTYNVD